ncbi:MAG: Arc family DNA binding domain-containing protein [Gammaproteobacteria bacterium]|nr:Arc family DNA binding domain-containing protein [Gammaproteobacteria bacterium]
MAARKPFALRISAPVLQAMQRWADDDLRSLNGQIEWVLREALRRSGRLHTDAPEPVVESEHNSE